MSSLFFKLTCTNFKFQLEKVYDPKNEEDDMVEMEEERLRMREHVMNEVGADSLLCSKNAVLLT